MWMQQGEEHDHGTAMVELPIACTKVYTMPCIIVTSCSLQECERGQKGIDATLGQHPYHLPLQYMSIGVYEAGAR